ncbi:hypothetical protein BN2537_15699 [Streptomyces venezuelae]|nr:hypothetical protein BN2537_15699 [Streptomyces venezuelae]
MDAALEEGGPSGHHGQRAHHAGEDEQDHVERSETEDQGPGQPDRGERDRRNRQADAGDRGAVGEVEAGLHAVPAGRADGGEGLGQQHHQGDDDTDDRLGKARRLDAVLDGRGDQLGVADDGDEGDHEESEAGPGIAPGRRVRVLVLRVVAGTRYGEEVVPVPHGLDTDEHAVQTE